MITRLVPRSIVIALLVAAGVAVAAQPAALPRADPASVGLDPGPLREATALLHRFVAEQKIAGAVAAVARRGQVAYLEAAGFQDLESRAPMTERSIFRIYSMAKAVTAVAAMILYEEGRFDLRDPVSKYLPEFEQVRVVEPDGRSRPPARAITVADLLLHTSGLSHRTSELYRTAGVRSRSISLPQFITNIVRAPLMEDPGTRYRYSEGTTVVGRLVEVWSGKPLDVFMRERLFEPLGMVDTGFWATPGQRARLTTVYAAQPGGGLRPYEIEAVPFTERPALLEGAVGLLSTAPDFLRFAQMLLDRGQLGGTRILSAKTVDLMTADGLPADVRRARGGPFGWGLANVNVADDGEYGWDGSAGTIFWVDPARALVTVLLTQSSPANPDGLRDRFRNSVQQAAGRRAEAPSRP